MRDAAREVPGPVNGVDGPRVAADRGPVRGALLAEHAVLRIALGEQLGDQPLDPLVGLGHEVVGALAAHRAAAIAERSQRLRGGLRGDLLRRFEPLAQDRLRLSRGAARRGSAGR